MWLYNLAKIAPQCLDIYAEASTLRVYNSSFEEKEIEHYVSPLQGVINTLSHCLSAYEEIKEDDTIPFQVK